MRCRISAQIDVEHIVGVVLADHHQSLFVSFHLGVAGVAPCHDAGDRRAVVVIRHHPIAAFPCHRTRAERHHHGHERRAPCQRMQAAGATAHATKHDDHHADSQADAAAAQCGETQHAQGVIPINRHRNGVPARSGDRQQCQPSVTSTSSGPAGLRRARFDCGAATVGGAVKVGGTLAAANAAGGFTGC